MASLYTLYKNVIGALVAYAEVDLGSGSDGTPRRLPRSAPSDESGASLFVSANPGHVTLDAQAAGLSTAAAQASQLTALGSLLSQLQGTLQVGWSARLPVDIGSATVTISGPVTVSNEVEIKNDAGSPVPVQERAAQGAIPLTVGAAAIAAGRLLFVNCSVPGDVSVTFADASTLVVPVSAGPQFFPFALTKINAAGTTATATYANLA